MLAIATAANNYIFLVVASRTHSDELAHDIYSRVFRIMPKAIAKQVH